MHDISALPRQDIPLAQPMSVQKSGIADTDKSISRTSNGNIETGGGKPKLEQRSWGHELMREIAVGIARIAGTFSPLLALAGAISFVIFPPAAIPLLIAAGGLLLGGLAVGGVTDIIECIVERREESPSDENNALEAQARADYNRKAAYLDLSPDKLVSTTQAGDNETPDGFIVIGEDYN